MINISFSRPVKVQAPVETETQALLWQAKAREAEMEQMEVILNRMTETATEMGNRQLLPDQGDARRDSLKQKLEVQKLSLKQMGL